MKHDYCVACGIKENLHQHHLIPKSLGGSDKKDNILTLCGKHHALIHGNFTEWNTSELIRKGIERARKKRERIADLLKQPLSEQESYQELHSDMRSTIIFEKEVATNFRFVVKSYLNKSYTEIDAIEHMKEIFIEGDYPNIKKSNSNWISSILIDLITDNKIRKRLLKMIKGGR